MASGFSFYMGKFVTVFCRDKTEFKGTLVNIDNFGNLDLIVSMEEGKMKFTILRPFIIAVGSIVEKII